MEDLEILAEIDLRGSAMAQEMVKLGQFSMAPHYTEESTKAEKIASTLNLLLCAFHQLDMEDAAVALNIALDRLGVAGSCILAVDTNTEDWKLRVVCKKEG